MRPLLPHPRPRRGARPRRRRRRGAIDYGRQLVDATYAFIGPEVADPAMRYAGNNLACQDCHLDGGRTSHGLALVGRVGEVSQGAARRRHARRWPSGSTAA